MNYEICVIGGEALLFPFLQFGFATFTPGSEKELRDYIQSAVNKNYGIIYIEDSYCFAVKDILDRYADSPTPIFVPIGEGKGGESYSRVAAREMTEKAVGINIL